jgi:hypothetical protein
MATTQRERSEDVNIIEMESAVGKAEELTPSDRMRLSIALRVLGALAILICASGAAMLYGPLDRLEQAKTIFEFVKTIAPPIATLVIGFYFRSDNG